MSYAVGGRRRTVKSCCLTRTCHWRVRQCARACRRVGTGSVVSFLGAGPDMRERLVAAPDGLFKTVACIKEKNICIFRTHFFVFVLYQSWYEKYS
jgi:hypothetical protein